MSLAAAGLSNTGCRHTPSPQDTPPKSVRLVIGYADVRPTSSSDAGLNALISLLTNERLVQIRRDGTLEPNLVERWTLSDDRLTWRFNLRHGLRFHDGQTVSASVVASALRTWVDKTRLAGISPGAREIERIDPVSENELHVRLRRPSTLFLEALSFIPLMSPASAVDDRSMGTGPFELVSRRSGGAVLKAFNDYHGGRSLVDEVELRLYPDARNAWGAMMRGEIDFLYDVAPEALDFVASTTQVRYFMRPYVYALGFNMRHPQLRNRQVRLALNAAVDRPAIINIALGGRGYLAAGHVWPRHWAYDHRLPRPVYSPLRATQILDAEGVGMKKHVQATHTPSRFSFTCILPAGDTRFERMALMLQRQLIDIGVDMRLEALPPSQLVQRLSSGDFDAFLFELVSGQGFDWVYWFWHSDTGGGSWINSAYHGADAALDRIRVAQNEAEIRSAVHDLQVAFQEDPPALFLCWSETARAVSRRFDIPPTVDRDILSTVTKWRLARPESSP